MHAQDSARSVNVSDWSSEKTRTSYLLPVLNIITAVNQITVIAAGQSPAAAMWEPSLDFLFKMHSNASLLHVTCFCACLKYVYKNPCLYGAEQCAFRPSVLSTMESALTCAAESGPESWFPLLPECGGKEKALLWTLKWTLSVHIMSRSGHCGRGRW